MPTPIIKVPKYCDTIQKLQVGDILLFRPPKGGSFVTSGIQTLQRGAGKHLRYGHIGTTHAAICVGRNEVTGEPIIAHLIGNGYTKEPLKNMLIRDGGDRAFIAYRPKDTEIAKKLAAVSGDSENNKKITYALAAAFRAILTDTTMGMSRLDPKRKETPRFKAKVKEKVVSAFCSKFVVQMLKRATLGLENSAYYPDLASQATPRTLESYLHEDNNYDALVYAGVERDPYEILTERIRVHVERLGRQTSPSAQAKYQKCLKNLTIIHETLKAENPERDPLQKSLLLLNVMLPTLRINTGQSLVLPTSYKDVLKTAEDMGVYERDAFQYPHIPEGLYSKLRTKPIKRHFSDSASVNAQFSQKSSFTNNIALFSNNVQNIHAAEFMVAFEKLSENLKNKFDNYSVEKNGNTHCTVKIGNKPILNINLTRAQIHVRSTISPKTAHERSNEIHSIKLAILATGDKNPKIRSGKPERVLALYEALRKEGLNPTIDPKINISAQQIQEVETKFRRK